MELCDAFEPGLPWPAYKKQTLSDYNVVLGYGRGVLGYGFNYERMSGSGVMRRFEKGSVLRHEVGRFE